MSTAKRSRKRKRVTIQDVARGAGVSMMTASRALTGGNGVRVGTRDAVLAAARRLKYAPNIAARSLALAHAERFGLLHGTPSTAYLCELLIGVLEESNRVGAQVVLEKCEPNLTEAKRVVRNLARAGVIGVMLPPPLGESTAILSELRNAGFQVVAIAAGRPRNDTMCVWIDDFSAAYEMTRHLLELGHRRIGFIKGHPNQTASDERWRGFLAASREAVDDVCEIQVEQGFFSYRSGLEAARKLLSQPQRPTAIFASNDDMAAAVVAEAHRRGLDVPRDLTVVGFDDSPIACKIWPELTTVRRPIVEMAAEAVRMLVAATGRDLVATQTASRHKLLSHTLIARGSAAPPPSRN